MSLISLSQGGFCHRGCDFDFVEAFTVFARECKLCSVYKTLELFIRHDKTVSQLVSTLKMISIHFFLQATSF